ncbi:MAG: hypothetical protein GXP40_07335 [Chloroflexi bacterium]|nr:hypothetical protein [Chloroflexota bacterium]
MIVDTAYLTTLTLSAAGVALVYSVLCRQSGLGQRASAIIAICFGVITMLYLQDHPQVLDTIVERIALTILAALVALAVFVRKKTP